MSPKLLPLALFLTLIPPTRAPADSYTWAGPTGNFSNPASWLTPAPTPAGSPTDQLIFPQSPDGNSQTATVDTPWTLNSLTFDTNFDSPYTIAGTNNASLLFTGQSPTISAIYGSGFNFPTIAVPITSTSNLAITGFLNLTQPLSFTDPNSQLLIQGLLIYTNNTAPTGLGSTIAGPTPNWMNTGEIQWNYSVSSSQPITLSFGNGPIVFNNGSFVLNLTTLPNITSASATLTNPLVVQYGGVLGISTVSPLTSATLNFSGPVTLGGQLAFSNQNYTWTSATLSTTIILSGTITLDQSAASQGPQLEAGFIDTPQAAIISGNIIDDPDPTHTAGYPLYLQGTLNYSPGNTFTIAGTANSWSTGTVIEGGVVSVAPNSTLGTGPVTVTGGTLQISSPSNIPANRKVLIGQYGALAFTFNQSPYDLIDPASQGTFAIDTTFTTPLDMSKLGNGLMSLTTDYNGIYAATSLLPDSDHIYHLAPVLGSQPNVTLTILNSVLQDYNGIPSQALLASVTLASSNSYSGGSTILGDVYAAAPGALGTGNITIGQPLYNDPAYGRLFLTAPNAYATTATIDVYGTLAAIGPNGSIPLTATAPILHPGSILILGDNLTNNSDRYPDSMPLHLNFSTLILKGIGITAETVGPISISGVSTIVLENPTTGNNTTTLLAPSLTRIGPSVLFLIPYQPPVNYQDPTTIPFSPDGNNNANFLLAASPPVTNGMVAPWIQTRTQFYYNPAEFGPPNPPASFLTYTPAGFALATYTTMPTTSGTATEIVDLTPNDNNIYLPAADPNPTPASPPNAFTLPANTSIYALRTSTNIANPASGPVTLHIASGGLIAVPDYNNLLIQPNIDFGSAEAIINVDVEVESLATTEISGSVSAPNGLTKIGLGSLILSNPNNQIHGPITILEGNLTLAALPDPNSTIPITISNNAGLSFTSSTVLTRPIHATTSNVFPGQYGAIISIPSGMTLTIAAPITGDATVEIQGGNIAITAPITIANTLYITADQITLSANITCAGLSLAGNVRGTATITTSQDAVFESGTISPGNNPGDIATLIIDSSSTEFNSDTTLQIDLDSSGHSDRLLFTGELDIYPGNADNDGSFLSLNFLAPPTGDIYTLLSAASLTGTFASVTGLPPGYTLDYTPTSLLLIPTAASPASSLPEPTTLPLLALATLPLLLRRRHR